MLHEFFFEMLSPCVHEVLMIPQFMKINLSNLLVYFKAFVLSQTYLSGKYYNSTYGIKYLKNLIPLFELSALPAIFTQALKNQTAVEGESISFQCELSKADIPVEWRRGEIGLCPCAKYEFKQDGHHAQLVIHDLEPEDSGDYICDTGERQSIAYLEVKGRLGLNPLSNKSFYNPVSFETISFDDTETLAFCSTASSFQIISERFGN